MLEKDIQRAILQYLNLRGYVCKRNNSGMMVVPGSGTHNRRVMRLGEAGWPDIIGLMKDGRFFGIEVKRKGGLLTSEQGRMIQRINASGGLAFMASSLDEVTNRGF